MEHDNLNNEPGLVSEKIMALFKRLDSHGQRICLRELSDELDITLNFDLITELKLRLKSLEIERGELKSYIEELEDEKKEIAAQLNQSSKARMSWEEMLASIPKEVRLDIRERLQEALFYRKLGEENKNLRRKYSESQKAYNILNEEYIMLKLAMARMQREKE